MHVISPSLLQRYDVAGPRYTSYPTADRFVEAFGAEEADRAMVHRVIFDELCRGRIEAASRREFERVVGDLAGRGAERLGVAIWLSFAKLVLHPALVALAAFVIFPVDPSAAGVMVAAASLPVAGNVYILAQHYGVAPQRVSTAILVSTAASILTVTMIIAWITG